MVRQKLSSAGPVGRQLNVRERGPVRDAGQGKSLGTVLIPNRKQAYESDQRKSPFIPTTEIPTCEIFCERVRRLIPGGAGHRMRAIRNNTDEPVVCGVPGVVLSCDSTGLRSLLGNPVVEKKIRHNLLHLRHCGL